MHGGDKAALMKRMFPLKLREGAESQAMVQSQELGMLALKKNFN